MRYYFVLDTDPKSPKYNHPMNVLRVNVDPAAGPHVSEHYSQGNKTWVDDPNVLRGISGIGGDGGEYKEVTEQQANDFIANLDHPKTAPLIVNMAGYDKMTPEEQDKFITDLRVKVDKRFPDPRKSKTEAKNEQEKDDNKKDSP